MDRQINTIFAEDITAKQSFEEDELDRSFDGGYGENDDESDFQNGNENIDNILDGEEETRGEMILRFKVNQLQKICNGLSSTNQRLIKKIAKLEEEKERQSPSNVFVDQYSELNTDFTEVEHFIQEYRSSLNEFEKCVLTDLKAKDEIIDHLKKETKKLAKERNDLEREKLDIEKLNRQLETKNQDLIIEIENLEKERALVEEKLTARTTSHKQPEKYDSSVFDEEISNQVQVKYQELIDKLVKELQYEKKTKKKLNDEIKRMSSELLESEKEIMEKNKKIYEIELKLLKANKSNFERSPQKIQQKGNKNGKSLATKFDSRNTVSSFSLIQLINGELQESISVKQRKILGQKIIEFYQRKLSKEDFSNVMIENLQVTNFNRRRPQMVLIRRIGTSAFEDGQKTEESLIQNLAFILDYLFGQLPNDEFDQILETTNQMLEKQLESNRSNLDLIKQMLSN